MSSLVFSGDVSTSYSKHFLCVSQHRNRPRLGRPRSKRTPQMPVPMSSVNAHLLTKPSRASAAVCPGSELVEPWRQRVSLGAWLGGVSKCVERSRYDSTTINTNGFFCSGRNYAEQGLSHLSAERMCARRAVSLRHAASGNVFRPSILMGVRGGSALDILVVAPGTSSSDGRVLDTHYRSMSKVGNAAPQIYRAANQVYVVLLYHTQTFSLLNLHLCIFCFFCVAADAAVALPLMPLLLHWFSAVYLTARLFFFPS